MVDYRACIRIRSSSSPKSESLSAYSFALVFSDWGMIGITVPPSHNWSDIFLSFLNVTASSSELLLSSALNLHNRHWNRVLFVVQWFSGENLRSREDGCALAQLVFEGCAYILILELPFVHLHSWGSVHDALVKKIETCGWKRGRIT